MSTSNITKAFSFIVSASALGLLMGSSGCTVGSASMEEDDARIANDDAETSLVDDEQVDDGQPSVDSIPDVNNESAESGVVTQYCILEITADGTVSSDTRRCYASEEERLIGEGPDGYDTLPRSKKTQEPSSFGPGSGSWFYYVGDFYEHINGGGEMTTVITADSSCPQISDISSAFSGWNDRISSFRFNPGNSPYANLGCNVVVGYEHSNYGGNNKSVQFTGDGCYPKVWPISCVDYKCYTSNTTGTTHNVSSMGTWTTSCGQYCEAQDNLNDKISSIRFMRDCEQRLEKYFDRSNTSSATVNYETLPFYLDRSAVVQASTNSNCKVGGTAYSTGDTYIRLFNVGTGQQVALNDDSTCSGTSSLASFISAITLQSGNYELRIGCYNSTSCSGKAVVNVEKIYP